MEVRHSCDRQRDCFQYRFIPMKLWSIVYMHASWTKTMDVKQKDVLEKWNKENIGCFSRATSPHWMWSVQNKSKKIYRCCLFLSFITGRLCLTRSSLQQAPNLARWVWHQSRQINSSPTLISWFPCKITEEFPDFLIILRNYLLMWGRITIFLTKLQGNHEIWRVNVWRLKMCDI